MAKNFFADLVNKDLDVRYAAAEEKLKKQNKKQNKLKKPVRHVKNFVKESLNENLSSNVEVAKEIIANKADLRDEYEKWVYSAIFNIAVQVKNGMDVNDAIFQYADQRKWFEAMPVHLKTSKEKYLNLIEIIEELGFELNDDMMEILQNKDKLMNESESLNEKKRIDPVSLFIDKKLKGTGMDSGDFYSELPDIMGQMMDTGDLIEEILDFVEALPIKKQLEWYSGWLDGFMMERGVDEDEEEYNEDEED